MPQPAPNDAKQLRLYLLKAGEVGLRAYVEMMIGAMAARAARSPSHVDDVLVILLRVLVERLFPPPPPASSPVQD